MLGLLYSIHYYNTLMKLFKKKNNVSNKSNIGAYISQRECDISRVLCDKSHTF